MAENLSIQINKNYDVNIKQIEHQMENVIDNMLGMREEIIKFLNSDKDKSLSEKYYQYLSQIPRELQFNMVQSSESISKHDFQDIYLNNLDTLIKVYLELKTHLVYDDMNINSFGDKLFESIDKDNVDGQLFINKMKELSDSNQLMVVVCKDRCSYYDRALGYVAINIETIKHGDITTLAHELGHLLHYKILNAEIPDDFKMVIAGAKTYASENGKLKKVLGKYKKNYDDAYNQAKKETSVTTRERIRGAIEMVIPEAPFQRYINTEKNWKRIWEILFEKTEFTTKLADIIDAVYEGAVPDMNESFSYLSSHGLNYYFKFSPFIEIIADFTALKVTDNKHDLELIREMFGKEFYDMLDTTFQKLVQSSLINEPHLENTILKWDYAGTSNLKLDDYDQGKTKK